MANGTRRTRHRPRRHETIPGTEGGIGFGGLDRDEPGADTPAGRQLGLDDRDIPGGQPHLVNPESPTSKPAVKEPRPLFDGMQTHGVPDEEPGGGYEKPPDDVSKAARPAGIPVWEDSVPVRIVEGKKSRILRIAVCDSIYVAASTGIPTRLCNIDRARVHLDILNEDTLNDVRVGTRDDCITGRAALISHFSNSYTRLVTQDELFAISTATSTVKVSVIAETEVADG